MEIFDVFFGPIIDFLSHPLITKGGVKRQEKKWRREAIRLGATDVVVRFDSFEVESIPYFVMPNENVDDVCARITSAGAHSVGRVIAIAHHATN